MGLNSLIEQDARARRAASVANHGIGILQYAHGVGRCSNGDLPLPVSTTVHGRRRRYLEICLRPPFLCAGT